MKNKAYKSNNILHRIDGPAILVEDGSECWYVNGLKHRIDGPAVTLSNGSKYWYVNGVLHREDGPAIEYFDGTKYWYFNGQKHRMDGPAVERKSGRTQFWLYGLRVSQEILEQFIFDVTNYNKKRLEDKRQDSMNEMNEFFVSEKNTIAENIPQITNDDEIINNEHQPSIKETLQKKEIRTFFGMPINNSDPFIPEDPNQ